MTERKTQQEVFAFSSGREIPVSAFLCDVGLVAENIEPKTRLLLECLDRYKFAVVFLAGCIRSAPLILPPDQGRMTLEEIEASGPGIRRIQDHDLDRLLFDSACRISTSFDSLQVEGSQKNSDIAVVTFTSGTRGRPEPHHKTQATLSASAQLIDHFLGGVHGVRIVATVPPQHMYGLETSILLPLYCGAILDGRRPFFPADIVRAIEEGPGPAALVTTPFHLSALLRDRHLKMPKVRFLVSATAPLEPELALEAEQRFGAPLLEIYGCTELGSIAGRRTAVSSEWGWFLGVSSREEKGQSVVTAAHVPGIASKADRIVPSVEGRFFLQGRQGDLINVAGKRTSLGHLERQALRLKGIRDVVFLQYPAGEHPVARMVAVVVADPDLSLSAIQGLFRQSFDPAFVPRRIVRLDSIPRNKTGKVVRDTLESLFRSGNRHEAP